MSTRVRGFPPIRPQHARVLILGSMPGVASLQAGAYYAHPRNHFWPLMGRILGFDATLPYAERCAHLAAAGVAVWDVLQECVRPGSLDSAIERAGSLPNDIPGLLREQPAIRTLLFNGSAAEQLFRQRILPDMPTDMPATLQRLPSTSPANAGMRFEAKLARWQEALNAALQNAPPR